MALFVAIHQHAPDDCPASDPARASALLSHLSPAMAGRYGVAVHAEAVVDDEHVVYLIAEATDEGQLRRYLAPFARHGPVEVVSASSCQTVIERRSCALHGAARPGTGRHRQL